MELLKTLYDMYERTDRKILKFEVFIYILLSISFAYGFCTQIYAYFMYHKLQLVPTIIEGLLLIIFVIQMTLMIESLRGIYPFKDKTKVVKNKKKNRKARKTSSNNKITKFPGT